MILNKITQIYHSLLYTQAGYEREKKRECLMCNFASVPHM